MAHDYCPYELVFGKTSNLPKHFNSIDKIQPLYNIEDYAKESKFRLEQAIKRARLMLESHKLKQKTRKNAIVKYLDYQIPVTQLCYMEICKQQSEIKMRHLPEVYRFKRYGR